MMSDQENAALALVHGLAGDTWCESWGMQEAAVNVFGTNGGFGPGLKLMMDAGELLRRYLSEEVRAQLVTDLRGFLADMRLAEEGP